MYELLGTSLALATLLTINAVASLAAVGLWRLIERPMRSCSARTRAEVLFAMRVGPSALAVISVAGFLAPSYLVYEPYSTNESVSKKLGALAIVSAIGVALALWRGVRSWRATRSLLRKWLDAATPIHLSEIDVPTFRIPHSFPIIAVVGMFRPRLFIAGGRDQGAGSGRDGRGFAPRTKYRTSGGTRQPEGKAARGLPRSQDESSPPVVRSASLVRKCRSCRGRARGRSRLGCCPEPGVGPDRDCANGSRGSTTLDPGGLVYSRR